jgi:hypothetical protein
MWSDDTVYESVDEREPSDLEVPDHIEEWNELWFNSTFTLRELQIYVAFRQFLELAELTDEAA